MKLLLPCRKAIPLLLSTLFASLLSLAPPLLAPASALDSAESTTEKAPEPLQPSSSIREPGRIGVGLAIGTGAWPVSAKYFITRDASVEVTGPFWGIFWGFGIGLTADGLYEGAPFVQQPNFELAWQVGGGVDLYYYTTTYQNLEYGNRALFGMHVNVGLQCLFTHLPIDIVLEYRPGFVLRPYYFETCDPQGNCSRKDTGIAPFSDPLQVALLARYYF